MKNKILGIRLNRIWLGITIVWMTCVPFFVCKHYEPIQNEYRYIYNPFVSSKHLLASNKLTRKELKNYFSISAGYNTYCKIIPRKIRISFPAFYKQGLNYVWIPNGENLVLVLNDSDQWNSFLNELINEGMLMRQKSKNEILDKYLLIDILTMIGPSLIFFLVWALIY